MRATTPTKTSKTITATAITEPQPAHFALFTPFFRSSNKKGNAFLSTVVVALILTN